MSQKKTKEDILAEMHDLTAELIMARLKDPDCNHLWAAQALRFLKQNEITVDLKNSPKLQAIKDSLEVEVDELPFN